MSKVPSNTRRQFAAVVLGGALVPALATTALGQTGAKSQVDANVRVVTRFLTEVVNGKRFDLVEELWAPNMIWRGASMGEVHGVKAFQKGLASDVDVTFRDMKLEIKDIIAAGDKVVVYFTNSGINVGPYRGQPATGKYAIWEGMGIYRLDDGKIVEGTFCEDLYGQLLMLGRAGSCL